MFEEWIKIFGHVCLTDLTWIAGRYGLLWHGIEIVSLCTFKFFLELSAMPLVRIRFGFSSLGFL